MYIKNKNIKDDKINKNKQFFLVINLKNFMNIFTKNFSLLGRIIAIVIKIENNKNKIKNR